MNKGRDGREQEREKNINVQLPLMCPLLGTWPATEACALSGNWTSNPLVHSLVLSLLSHTSQCSAFIFINTLLIFFCLFYFYLIFSRCLFKFSVILSFLLIHIMGFSLITVLPIPYRFRYLFSLQLISVNFKSSLYVASYPKVFKNNLLLFYF